VSWEIDAFARSLTAASANTVVAYRSDVGAFTEWAGRSGHDGPAGVDRLVLRRYLAHLSTCRYAKRTIARKAAALRRYFDWCRRTGRITIDPARHLSAPSGDARLPRVLTHDELATLLDDPPAAVADDQLFRGRDDAVLELLYGSGLRVSELCGLDLNDVDVGRRVVTAWGKGAKQRQVPMSQPAADALAAWLSDGRAALMQPDSPPDAVFFNRRGRRLGPRDVRRLLDRADPSSRSASQLCHPPPRRRGRPSGGAGVARSRQCAHDAGLHSCIKGTSAADPRADAPTRVGVLDRGSR
jgi:site-specific recombinase XerD